MADDWIGREDKMKKRIYALEEEKEKLRKILTDILDAHHLAEVDWDAMREAEKMIGYTFTLDDEESGTPYGCKCKTLHHRVTGDGCHICNPPESGEKRNVNVVSYNQTGGITTGGSE